MKTEHSYTLKELKAKMASTDGQALPTAKALRENGIPLASTHVAEAKLTAYQNGFALYEASEGSTVFRKEDCGGYVYHSADGDKAVPESSFSCTDWSVRFLMEGEDRLWHNREVAHGDRHGTKHDLDEAWGDALSVSENPLNRTIDRIACEQVLKCLTDRQREIVIAYYWGSCSQREIAHSLGISQPVLKKTLDAAIKKIKKFF